MEEVGVKNEVVTDLAEEPAKIEQRIDNETRQNLRDEEQNNTASQC